MTPFHNILLPLDLGAPTARVAAYAAAIARLCEASLTLLHVYEPSPNANGDDARATLLDELSDLAACLEAGRRPRITLRAGEPTREILSYADSHAVDLLVLPSFHRGALDRLLLSSTSERTTLSARCSVLAVPDACGDPALDSPPRRILCAVDLADGSLETLNAALALASAMRAHVTLLHAIDAWRWEDPWPLARMETGAIRRELAHSAEQRLSALIFRAAGDTMRVDTLVVSGRPSEQIARAAEAQRPDLLVVGAPRARLLGHTILGRTARSLLHEVRCPLLLLAHFAPRGERAVTVAEDPVVLSLP